MEKVETKSEFPVNCAWCEANGVQRVVGWSGIEDSHGICPERLKELLEEDEQNVSERHRGTD